MTLANAVTLFRIALVPVFVGMFFSTGEYSRFLVAGVFVLSGVSDILDGYLARSRNEVSRFGTLVDPLADKLIMLVALWSLVWVGKLPFWIAVVVLAKEVGLVVGASYLFVNKARVVQARNLGKAATVILYIGVTLAIVEFPFAHWIVIAGVVVSLTAGLDYLLLALRNRNE